MMEVLRRHRRLTAFATYAVLAVVATWPLLARFGTAVAGDGPGAWRTVWAFWWWGESIGRHASPFFSDALRWPTGAPLPLQVAQLPSAVAVLPLWPLTPAIPEVSLYNAVVLASYPLAGYATYLLARDLWGGELAPFLAGALHTVGVLHLGAAGQAVSIWPPVYFLGLVRTVRRHGVACPLVAGAALALAALTAPAYLAACLVGTAILAGAWWRNDRAALASPAFARRVALLLVTSVALAGWAYLGALPVARALPQAAAPGADLLSFLVPGRGSAWAPWATRGPAAAAAPFAHAGYVVLALAVVAAARATASRAWLAVAAAGLVLALGPHLRVAGAEFPRVPLPLGWVGAAWPGGMAAIAPGHFAGLATFGLAVVAGAALAQVVRARRGGAALAASLTLLAVAEAWPRPPATSSWPSPRFLRDLARDGERWTVLDATRPERQLWNQVLHRHPQLGGDVDDRGAAPGGAGTGSAVVDALLDRAPPASVAPGAAPAQRQDAVRALQRRNVRFVIVDEETLSAGRALRLPRAWAGDGLVVFEVPPGAG